MRPRTGPHDPRVRMRRCRRRSNSCWALLDEPELHLGGDIIVPDLAGWRRERMPFVANEPSFTIAPDWICEVLSPFTEKLDRAEKLAVYAAAGVHHAWLVIPRLRTLEVLRLHEGCGTTSARRSAPPNWALATARRPRACCERACTAAGDSRGGVARAHVGRGA